MMAGSQPLNTNACIPSDRVVGRTLAPTEMAALLEEFLMATKETLPFLVVWLTKMIREARNHHRDGIFAHSKLILVWRKEILLYNPMSVGTAYGRFSKVHCHASLKRLSGNFHGAKGIRFI